MLPYLCTRFLPSPPLSHVSVYPPGFLLSIFHHTPISHLPSAVYTSDSHTKATHSSTHPVCCPFPSLPRTVLSYNQATKPRGHLVLCIVRGVSAVADTAALPPSVKRPSHMSPRKLSSHSTLSPQRACGKKLQVFTSSPDPSS